MGCGLWAWKPVAHLRGGTDAGSAWAEVSGRCLRPLSLHVVVCPGGNVSLVRW